MLKWPKASTTLKLMGYARVFAQDFNNQGDSTLFLIHLGP